MTSTRLNEELGQNDSNRKNSSTSLRKHDMPDHIKEISDIIDDIITDIIADIIIENFSQNFFKKFFVRQFYSMKKMTSLLTSSMTSSMTSSTKNLEIFFFLENSYMISSLHQR